MRPEDQSAICYVVDDDPDMRLSLRRLIGHIGVEVREFGDAMQFLEGYDPNVVGCVVLDVRIPGMNGLELQKKLSLEAQ